MTLLEAGTLFEEKYRIEEEIGSGGFAAVYRALDETTGRHVAIKVLIPPKHDDDYGERIHARFEREARLLAGLRSQHIVTLYEFGKSEDDLRYLVFEYVNGTTLRDLLRMKGRQPPERVVAILRQVCTALHEAHQHGILHRDIKPANIMVYDHLEIRDVVKLLDFGIAKTIADGEAEQPSTDHTITTAGAVLGTPRYMSPEQLAHQELTPASDIYSLGLVAYELLTGERAIDEETPTGILRAQLSVEPVTFRRDHDVPRGLATVVEKMLAKQRHARYQDLSVALRDLEHWAEDDGSNRVAWVAGGALLLGVAAVLFALLRPAQPLVESVPATPHEVQLGQPAWLVPLDAPGLTFTYLSKLKSRELRGTTDPLRIPLGAHAAVLVERRGVATPPGKRHVGDFYRWDRTLSDKIVVTEVSQAHFDAMIDAMVLAVPVARNFATQVRGAALQSAVVVGRPLLVGRPEENPLLADAPTPARDGLALGGDEATSLYFAQAKAMRAEQANDWEGVIDACAPFAARHLFCAERMGRAHLAKNNLAEACRWFLRAGRVPASVTCESAAQ